MIAAKRAVHIQKVRAAPADIEPQQRCNVCNVERKLRRTGFDNGHTLSSKLDASSGFLLQIVQQNFADLPVGVRVADPVDLCIERQHPTGLLTVITVPYVP